MVKFIESLITRMKLSDPRRLAIFFGLAAVSLWLICAPLVQAKSSNISSQSHIVTFYDNDTEKTIITNQSTVKEALDDADIAVDDDDIISPNLDSQLKDSSTIVTIKRARPVTLVDDDGKRTRIMTAETDPAKIASQAGMALKSRDTTAVKPITNFIAAGGIGEELQVTRAKTVNVRLYGQTMTLRTQQKTVRGMLKEAGVKLTASDTTSIDMDAPIAENMSMEVWRNGIQTIEQQEDVPFETQTVEDSTKKLGYTEVQTTGVIGKKSVIYQVNMQNGVEVERQKISEVITVAPVAQVIVKGTKVELPPGSHTDWMRMAGISESDFGAANYIITRESGWRYNAKNPSGAYGLPQALPGNKMSSAGSDWATNPITQLRWFNSYCKQRYGSIQGAYNHWQSHHSY